MKNDAYFTSNLSPLPVGARSGSNAYHFMGAHPLTVNGVSGWHFRVWAPEAVSIALVGSFNGWDPGRNPMHPETDGLWSLSLPGLQQYDLYQFAIRTKSGELLYKSDPFAFHTDTRPGYASKLYDLSGYQWGDETWMAYRKRKEDRPINFYEVHLGSWRRTGQGGFLNYRVIASYLVPYVKEMGFTHVSIMPIMEHPLDSSLGYQATGYYAVTSRMGTPTDFMYLVDQLHRAGVGVFLDWGGSSTPANDWALCRFDGSHCYERPDSGGFFRGFDFQMEKTEVREFLLSSLFFWIEQFHADGIRIITPSPLTAQYLGRAVKRIREQHADVMVLTTEGDRNSFSLCEETAWSGWMLDLLSRPPSERRGPLLQHPSTHPQQVTAFNHSMALPPLPSITTKMAGNDAQRFATARALYLTSLARSGHNLLMMGTEFGQWSAWQYQQSLDWHLLQYEPYLRQQQFFRAANDLYLTLPSLWGTHPMEVLMDRTSQPLAVWCRWTRAGDRIFFAVNFTDQTVSRLPVRVREDGLYQVLISTDDIAFGGSGISSTGTLQTRKGTLMLSLAPNSAVLLRQQKSTE